MQQFKKYILASFLLVSGHSALAQTSMKKIEELVCGGSAGWDRILALAEHARNGVDIQPKDSAKASLALVQSQLSTNTMLGSVIYNCGGILIDGGWLRILASGCTRLPRSIPEWNAGKIKATKNDETFYLLVADDVLGGLFAIKAATVEELETTGQVFYYGPNSLTWQSTGLNYASFLGFCFSGNLKDFYDDFRWKGWQDDIKTINCNLVISCYPMLWTREGLQIKSNRKLLAIQTQWNMYQGKSKSGGKQKAVAQHQPARRPTTAVESMWSLNTGPR